MTKDLHELIEAIIADGKITDKERRVLHQRAVAEGISIDEIDVLVDGKLMQRQNKLKSWQTSDQTSSEPTTGTSSGKKNTTQNHGVVKKCPNCGALVDSGLTKCEECGYTFRGIEANSAVQQLADKLNEATQQYYNSHLSSRERTKAISSIILNFPVPTTKEDLLEFIFFTKSKSTGNQIDYNDRILAQAYGRKYMECIDKAKFYFGSDPQFQPIFKENQKFKLQNFRFRWNSWGLFGKIMFCILAYIFFMLFLTFLLALTN